MSPRTAILAVLFFAGLSGALGRTRTADLRFRHFSLGQGLSQSTVTAISQDRQGFMWFGTQDGLNRFDGYAFTVYRHQPSDTASLSDNYVWTMLQDGNGDLWVGTVNNGLNMYSADRTQFSHFSHMNGDSTSLSANNVTALAVNARGELFVGTWDGGLQKFDHASGRFRHMTTASRRIQCLLIDRSDCLWVGTSTGLELFDRNGNLIARYRQEKRNPHSLNGDNIDALFETSDGNVWVGTFDAGLSRFNRKEGTFTQFRHAAMNAQSLGSDAVRCLAQDRSGRLWIGTANQGIDLFDGQDDSFSHLRADPFNRDAISSDRIASLFLDNTGGIWVGTMDAGVNRYDPWGQNFSNVLNNPSDPASLSGNTVRSILATRDKELWVGTWGGGLNRLMPGSDLFIHYRHRPDDAASLGSDAVMTIFEGDDAALWIGTADAGLDRFDRKSGKFRHYRHDPQDPNSIASNTVIAIAQDRSGSLWIGSSYGGVDTLDRRSGRFHHFRPRPGDSTSISGLNVWAIHQDRKGMLWMGTWGMGLNRFDPGSGAFKHYMHDPANPRTLSNNTVWAMYEDPGGFLWLGTWGGGLDRYDPRIDSFEAFMESDGLPNNVVYGILPDREGNLWLSTNKGISRFDPRTRGFRNFDVLDGLQGNEFNQGAYFRAEDGMLYFGGVNGYSAFYPDSIKANPSPPRIVLTSFQVFNKPVPLGAAKEIVLSYRQNFFSFEFSALSYTIPEKNLYAYKLEGFDKDWVYCGTRRYVSYTQLNGGDYVFRVKGSNNDGVWNEEGTALRIHITPPFYRTWSFFIGVLLVVGVLVYGIYRFRLNKLIEVERLRTRIASDLHDDIGSGLTRIAVLSDIASQQFETILKRRPDGPAEQGESEGGAGTSIQKVGRIARELVDAMSDVVWSIDPRHESAASLVQRVRAYAFELCEAKNITLTFTAPDVPAPSKLSPETLRSILLLTKEAVTNIVRHSQCTAALIRIEFGRGEIMLQVCDNGVGFAPGEGDGNGLRNMRERAEKTGGSFSIVSEPREGTVLSITLPST